MAATVGSLRKPSGKTLILASLDAGAHEALDELTLEEQGESEQHIHLEQDGEPARALDACRVLQLLGNLLERLPLYPSSLDDFSSSIRTRNS